MITKDYDYPYNPDGTLPDAVIKGEQQTVTAANGNNFTTIIPRCAPYFRKSLIVTQVGTGKRLAEGVDYVCSYFFKDFSLQTNLPLYGGITFLDKTYSGGVELGYATLGSEFVLSDADYLTLLANAQLDPRETDWREVVDKPAVYPPVPHRHDAADLYGMDDVAEALNNLKDAITNTSTGFFKALNEHAAARNNPHNVTKDQVGLGNVDNFKTATEDDLKTNVGNVFMTVAMTRLLIANIGGESAASHIANLNNPHQTTAAQVGLGNVDNFKTATNQEALDGSSTTLFITPSGAKALATKVTNDIVANLNNGSADLANHVNDKNNPHGVTATQVGLGNVPNYRMATDTEATAADNPQLFVNPTQIAAVANSVASGVVNVHANNKNNPHGVTKSQVGLGSVDNFVTATKEQAAIGSDKQSFVTPEGVRAAVEAIAPGLFTSHITNTNNPHNVNKQQVGLGNVDNFLTASSTEAAAGAATDVFVTPSGVKAYCDANVPSEADINTRLSNYLTDVEIATSAAELTAREQAGYYMPRVLFSWDNLQAVGEQALGGDIWTVGAHDALVGPAKLVSDSVQGWLDESNAINGVLNQTATLSASGSENGSLGILISNIVDSSGDYTRLYVLRSAGTSQRKLLSIVKDVNGTLTTLAETDGTLTKPSGGWAGYKGDILLNAAITVANNVVTLTVKTTEPGSTNYTAQLTLDVSANFADLATKYNRGVVALGVTGGRFQTNGGPVEVGAVFYTPDQSVYVYNTTDQSWEPTTDLAGQGIATPALLFDDRTHGLYNYNGTTVVQVAGQITQIVSTDTVKVSGSGTHADPYQLNVDLSAYVGDVMIDGSVDVSGDIHADGKVTQDATT